jgi:2,4-dienoyl-CoA reductase-like NADH-dependent reductase (Old Yellow Enzyme family)
VSTPQGLDVLGPARLGPIELRNRVVKAATFEAKTPGGFVTPELIDYHLAVAEGGVGLTTVAYLAVSEEGPTGAGGIVVDQRRARGLGQLADAIHATGAKISGQLGHAGPVANGRSNGVHAVAASRAFSPLSWQWVHAATEADLERITRQYAAAARILVDSGFDALEIHLAHSYLLSSFLAPGLNQRRDRWGGGLLNRARLARQVAQAVRNEVDGEAAVYAKISLNDGFRGGVNAEEGLELALILESDGTFDAFQMTGGSSLRNPMYLFRGDAPRKEFAAAMGQPLRTLMRLGGAAFLKEYPFEEAYFRDRALVWREELSIPLMLLGGINEKATMDQAMADGFEYVAMARALLREPDLINRMTAGKADRGICIHCNRCMPTIYSDGGTHCPVREADFR